jgi:hypothetical protein
MNPNAAFKGSAFTFASPLPKSNGNMDLNMGATMHSTSLMPPTSNNIWSDHTTNSNSKISFSDIVAKNTLNDLPLPNPIGKSSRGSMFEQHGQHNKMSVRRQLLQDGGGGMMKNQYNDRDYVEDISQSSTDLGPIGNRKSPLSTPSRESMPKPVPISQSYSYNQNSLFSVAFPQHNVDWTQAGYTNYVQQANVQQQRNGMLNVGDNNLSTTINNNNNNSYSLNQYYSSLTQDRDMSRLSLWSMDAAMQQQQQQQQQQHLLQQQMNANNWNNNNNYVVRPPPGFNNFSNEHQQDFHHRSTSHNSQEENNSQQQYHQQQQQYHQQQQQQSSNSSFDSYDPFRSIQSLWDTKVIDRMGWAAPSDDKKQQ